MLCTLQDFILGKVPFVSVAMDSDAFPYGTPLRIPEFEARFKVPITFLVVDTGRAFDKPGKNYDRIDICVKTRKYAYDEVGRMPVTLVCWG